MNLILEGMRKQARDELVKEAEGVESDDFIELRGHLLDQGYSKEDADMAAREILEAVPNLRPSAFGRLGRDIGLGGLLGGGVGGLGGAGLGALMGGTLSGSGAIAGALTGLLGGGALGALGGGIGAPITSSLYRGIAGPVPTTGEQVGGLGAAGGVTALANPGGIFGAPMVYKDFKRRQRAKKVFDELGLEKKSG